MRDLHTIETELRSLVEKRPDGRQREVGRINELLDEMNCSLAMLYGAGVQMWPD